MVGVGVRAGGVANGTSGGCERLYRVKKESHPTLETCHVFKASKDTLICVFAVAKGQFRNRFALTLG